MYNFWLSHHGGQVCELTKIFLTAAVTVVGGVLIFVIGQLVSKFILEPLQDYKQLLGNVSYSLIYFAGEIHTPVPGDTERCQIAHDEIRKLAAGISSYVESIPLYTVWSWLSFRFIPSRKLTKDAVSALIGISNSVPGNDRSHNGSREETIKRILSKG
jgi:hypothetical protein